MTWLLKRWVKYIFLYTSKHPHSFIFFINFCYIRYCLVIGKCFSIYTKIIKTYFIVCKYNIYNLYYIWIYLIIISHTYNIWVYIWLNLNWAIDRPQCFTDIKQRLYIKGKSK